MFIVVVCSFMYNGTVFPNPPCYSGQFGPDIVSEADCRDRVESVKRSRHPSPSGKDEFEVTCRERAPQWQVVR